MNHLVAEALARLVDEEPTPAEAAHLRACDSCTAELRALLEQTSLLGHLEDPPVPARLRSAVEVAVAEEVVARVRAHRRVLHSALRVAAALAIFVTGALAGTFGIAPALSGADQTAGATGADPVVAAATDLASAEARYVRAMARYAELVGSDAAVDPLNRLVALEGIVLTTEAALREAPADPLINNFHLSAVGQRDALLERIESATGDQDEWF